MNRLGTTSRPCTGLPVLLFALVLLLPGPTAAAPVPPDSADAPPGVLEGLATPGSESASPDSLRLDVDVNGSVRFNVLFRSYGSGNEPLFPSAPNVESSADHVLGDGGFTFDTFRIGAQGSYGRLLFDAEYALYPESLGGTFLHHGWVGYKFSDIRQIQVGVSQVPFGIQPYASSSWFFNSTYYLGLEDDYDAGIKALFRPGNWELQGGYYMNAEQTDFFSGATAQRYSYDVVPTTSAAYIPARGVSEAHQLNGKVTYTASHGTLGSTTVGVSAQRGQLLNENTGATDWHAAYAVHLRGRYAGFDVKLEFAQRSMNPPDVGDDRFVVMGAYGLPNRVASDIDVYASSLAYHAPVDLGPVSEIKPYYDFSLVTKDVEAWNSNASHVVGVRTSAGPLFVYADLIVSKGHPFNQPFDATFPGVLAAQPDNTWRTAFNVNLGVYF